MINPFSSKRFIITTTRRAPSLLGVAETFPSYKAIFFLSDFSPRTIEMSQKISKM